MEILIVGSFGLNIICFFFLLFMSNLVVKLYEKLSSLQESFDRAEELQSKIFSEMDVLPKNLEIYNPYNNRPLGELDRGIK